MLFSSSLEITDGYRDITLGEQPTLIHCGIESDLIRRSAAYRLLVLKE